MPRKPPKAKLSLRDAQLSIMSQAPHGFVNAESKFPMSFLDKTPRAAPKPREPGQKNAEPENDLQIICCDYLKLHPRILYWSTPNHIWMGKQTWAKINYMKKQQRMGLRKGMGDLNMLFRNKHGATVFVMAELKVGYNKPDDDQQAVLDAVNERGGFTAVVKSLDDLINLLVVAGY